MPSEALLFYLQTSEALLLETSRVYTAFESRPLFLSFIDLCLAQYTGLQSG